MADLSEFRILVRMEGQNVLLQMLENDHYLGRPLRGWHRDIITGEIVARYTDRTAGPTEEQRLQWIRSVQALDQDALLTLLRVPSKAPHWKWIQVVMENTRRKLKDVATQAAYVDF